MKRFVTFIAAFAVSGCGAISPHCASNDAQGLVEALKPEAQFKSMLKGVVDRTQTAKMATAKDGSAADQKLDQAINDTVERHAGEWKRNLVLSWQTLSPEEVEQVCTALEQRDQQTFTRFAQRVGSKVQSRNEPLLRRSAAEVLDAVW